MEILADLHVDTLNIKGLTREQFERVIPKLDVDRLRLRKSKINEELMEMGLAKVKHKRNSLKNIVQNIRHFSCTFSSPPDYIDFEALLDQKSTAAIELGPWVFDWSSLPYILLVGAFGSIPFELEANGILSGNARDVSVLHFFPRESNFLSS